MLNVMSNDIKHCLNEAYKCKELAQKPNLRTEERDFWMARAKVWEMLSESYAHASHLTDFLNWQVGKRVRWHGRGEPGQRLRKLEQEQEQEQEQASQSPLGPSKRNGLGNGVPLLQSPPVDGEKID